MDLHYEKSKVVCQIFNGLFQKLQNNHFGVIYPTILYLYFHASAKINK